MSVEFVEGLGMKRHFTSGLAALVLVALGSFPVKAESVTWYFRGTVTQRNVGFGPPFYIWKVPPEGSIIAGLIRFSVPPPQPVGAPLQTQAVWSNTISEVRLLRPFNFWQANGGTITVDDNSWSGLSRLDSIHFVAGDPISIKFDMRLEQSAIGATAPNAVKSINVPSKPPPLSSLDIATFTFGYDVIASFSGNITQLKRYIEATGTKNPIR